MIKEIRLLLASAIAGAKAYDVPALCRRLNLADGDEQEAYGSKLKYAHRRLVDVSPEQVIASARQLLAEEEHFELAEQVAIFDEMAGPHVSKITRKRIIGLFETFPLTRDVSEIDLLRDLWPIGSHKISSGYGERTLEDHFLGQVFVNGRLKPADLEALGLMTCSRAQLFRFLEAVVSPEVRAGHDQVELADKIDAFLKQDGFTLRVANRISNFPVYQVQHLSTASPADEHISAALAAFDLTVVHARWSTALERRNAEPEGAITLARTLLEDVCKWIINQSGDDWSEADDLPVLYRKLSKILKLAPDDHTEQIFKQILGSCQSVVESLGALRNKLGDAHSPGPKRSRPQSRHAELAVNLAGAMATFLVATWEARQKEADRPRA